jgi:hypothetical protein
LFFCALAASVYWKLTELEEQGGSARVHVVIAFLYKLAGKWGFVVVFGGLGQLSCLAGILNLIGIPVGAREDD